MYKYMNITKPLMIRNTNNSKSTMANNNKPTQFTFGNPIVITQKDMVRNIKPNFTFGNNSSPPRTFIKSPSILTRAKCDEIMDAAIDSNTNLVKQLLEYGYYKPSDSLLINKSKDNLLHLAVRTKNYMLVEYLLENNVQQTKNIFGETPSDIAMKNGDNKMMGLLLEVYKVNELKQTNKNLTYDNEAKEMALHNMTADTLKLKVNNESLQFSVNNLKNQVQNNELSLKRLRDTNDMTDREFKKLKVDHVQLTNDFVKLTNDHVVLQKTYTNLRNGMKK